MGVAESVLFVRFLICSHCDRICSLRRRSRLFGGYCAAAAAGCGCRRTPVVLSSACFGTSPRASAAIVSCVEGGTWRGGRCHCTGTAKNTLIAFPSESSLHNVQVCIQLVKQHLSCRDFTTVVSSALLSELTDACCVVTHAVHVSRLQHTERNFL